METLDDCFDLIKSHHKIFENNEGKFYKQVGGECIRTNEIDIDLKHSRKYQIKKKY